MKYLVKYRNILFEVVHISYFDKIKSVKNAPIKPSFNTFVYIVYCILYIRLRLSFWRPYFIILIYLLFQI